MSFSSNFSLYPFSTIKYLVLILFFFVEWRKKRNLVPVFSSLWSNKHGRQVRAFCSCCLRILSIPLPILNSPKFVRSYFKLLLAYSIFSFSISHLLLIVICKIIKEKIKGNFLSLSTSEFRQYNTEKTEIDASYIRKLVS